LSILNAQIASGQKTLLKSSALPKTTAASKK
jgi:hypothetical protein